MDLPSFPLHGKRYHGSAEGLSFPAVMVFISGSGG
jgi:hypothetical protein